MSEPPVRKYLLIIAFDGTAYAGWQLQKTGVSVQGKVEAALAHYYPSRPRLHSSSRTDAGVHALGMAAHFEAPLAECRLTPSKLVLALNAFLPEDIRVMKAAAKPAGFHARFDAAGKQYRYVVWNGPAMNPLLKNRAWHVPGKLDKEAMRQAAKRFLGKHDFRSFAVNHPYEVESTVRTVKRCDFKGQGGMLTFTIEADGFLYKMCRGIVGTIVQVGKGKFSATAIEGMLRAKDRTAAGMSAPAHGLTLWKVFYKGTRKGRG